MLSRERTRELLRDLDLTDEQIDEVRAFAWLLAGVVADRLKEKHKPTT